MAATRTIVTCEQIVSHELVTRYPKDIAIPFLSVDAIVEAPFGAYPGACRRHYYFNRQHINEFHAAASLMHKTESADALKAYYDKYVFAVEDSIGFMSLFPLTKIMDDKKVEANNCERLA